MLAHPAEAPGKSRQRVGMLVAIALVLVSVGVVAAVALTRGLSTGGGQDGSSAKDAGALTLEGKKLPEVGNLPPGKYVTDQFKPTMSFTLGGNDEWQIGAQLPDILNITPVDFVVPQGKPDVPPNLSFVSPREVYKPFDPSGGEELSPAPEDMGAWIRNHPDLKIEKTEPVTVGGVSGIQFDVSTAVGDSDVLLFRVGGGNEFFLANGNENRIIVLQDVGGQTVVIIIDGTKAQFEGFLPEAQKVLDTARFAAVSAPTVRNTIPTEGSIGPGEYVTDEFEPSFSFDLGDGWTVYGGAEQPDVMSLGVSDTLELERPSLLGFYRPQTVFDPEDPDQETLRPAPDSVDGWVAWFQEHPHLDTEEPVPITIGGISGVQIDSTTSSVPEGEPDLFMWTHEDGIEIADEKGAVARIIILEVEDETLLMSLSAARENNFEELLPRAQGVLDTLEWGG